MLNLILGDCLEEMKNIPNNTVDFILCDLPYGNVVACKWDVALSFDLLWIQYERIITQKGCIALFGSEPFASRMRLSNEKMYKYDWVWEKSKASNFAHSKYQPLKAHETISIFSKSPSAQNFKSKIGNNMIYNPQFSNGIPYNKGTHQWGANETLSKGMNKTLTFQSIDGKRFPRSVQYFKTAESEGKVIHNTQKPIAICEYLIRTYTNEYDTVLDNCMGSGSTAIACINTKRKFIGIEKDINCFEMAKQRIENHVI